MSTRYIWEQHELGSKYELSVEVENDIRVGTGTWYLIGMKTKPVFNQETRKCSYSGDCAVLTSDFYSSMGINTVGEYGYRYATVSRNDPSNGSGYGDITLTNIVEFFESDGVTEERYWNFFDEHNGGNNVYFLRLQNSLGQGQYSFNYYFVSSATPSPGVLLGYVSSNSSSSYPNDGESGNYYYKAIENDEIDPSSVTIPNQLIAGENATVTVTQSSGAIGSEYGNISYLFSYKYDSERWSQNTQGTGLTYSFNVASGKSQVIARVYAKDDIGFTSETAVESNIANIYASSLPTAPGSISINRVVNGWETTIKITPAMDTDGMIVNYKYYAAYKSQNGDIQWPNVNMEKATLISTINSLEISYLINSTVENEEIIFLVSAIDDSGLEGPTVNSSPYVIEKDKIVLLGPENTDFGTKISNFKVYFSGVVGGSISDKTFLLTVKNDTSQIYSNTIDSDEIAEVLIDISALSEGEHTITVTGSKEGYDKTMTEYVYRIQNLVVPKNVTLVQFQDSTGKSIFPMGSAQGVFLSDGTSLEDAIKSLGYQLQEGD